MIPFDPGLQPERTLLAWRRTCLSFGLASAIAVRFTIEVVGIAGVAGGLVGVALSLSAYIVVVRRHRIVTQSLLRGEGLRASALPMLLASAAAFMVGLAATAFIVGQIVSRVL